MKIALCGASGTGKTTVAKLFAEDKDFGCTYLPNNTRALAEAVTGVPEPYEVDSMGLRTLFQRVMLVMKRHVESHADDFITDRSYVDHVVYSLLHDKTGTAKDAEWIMHALSMQRMYHLVVFFPIARFCNLGNDKARKQDMEYQERWEECAKTLLSPDVHILKSTTPAAAVKEIQNVAAARAEAIFMETYAKIPSSL